MKKLSLIILLLSQSFLYAKTDKVIKSTIKNVTVYQQGAQINRKANYSISSGITQLIIEGISPLIDKKSIQVKGTGSMVILDSKYLIKYPKPLPRGTVKPTPKLDRELIVLNDSLLEYDYEIMDLQQQMDVLNTQKNILSNNGAIKGVGKVNDSIPLLKEAMDYYFIKMNTINKRLLELKKKKNTSTKIKTRIYNRINEIKNYKLKTQKNPNKNQAPIYSIVITVSSQTSTSGKLNISYLVSQAGWTPLYDIRSSSNKNNVDLTYKAQVYQNTGIDWNKTKLTLSTTNPYSNKTKPTLTPFYVNYYQNRRPTPITHTNRDVNNNSSKYGKKLTKKAEAVYEDLSTEETAEISSDYAYNYTTINEQLISVEYNINLPYSIPSNNEQHLVLVRQESLKSNYKFYTIPKLDPTAYLVAEINNLSDLNLIPGKANIFHDGTYLGETHINPSIMTDSLALSLGKDQNIQVKRTLLKNDCKTKVIGDKTIKTYAYLIEIKNHKSSTLNITLQDQIPVTQNSEIEIKVEEISKGDLNEITGLINWKLKLKSKETKTIKLIYSVSHSKQRATNLAQY